MIAKRHRTWATTLTTLLVTGLAMVAINPGWFAETTPVRPAPEGFKLTGDAKNGKKIYKQYCQMCHGKKGNGQGTMAVDLSPKPHDLTDKDYMKKRTDWEIYLGVKEGGASLGLSDQMSAFEDTLTEQEIHDVVVFTREFAEASPK